MIHGKRIQFELTRNHLRFFFFHHHHIITIYIRCKQQPRKTALDFSLAITMIGAYPTTRSEYCQFLQRLSFRKFNHRNKKISISVKEKFSSSSSLFINVRNILQNSLVSTKFVRHPITRAWIPNLNGGGNFILTNKVKKKQYNL